MDAGTISDLGMQKLAGTKSPVKGANLWVAALKEMTNDLVASKKNVRR